MSAEPGAGGTYTVGVLDFGFSPPPDFDPPFADFLLSQPNSLQNSSSSPETLSAADLVGGSAFATGSRNAWSIAESPDEPREFRSAQRSRRSARSPRAVEPLPSCRS